MRPIARRGMAALLLAATAMVHSHPGQAASRLPIAPRDIDSTVTRAMKAFDVPGVAVGIIKDGKLVFSKGYGVRELGKPAPIDADTLFQIGSNTKAFTAAALAMLVDEGKIHWDDRVLEYLPDFQMYDPYVTREFTIRDLLTHRSGLGMGAGDLMFFPTTDFSRAEIIHRLRYLKPASSFRTKFDYDNLLYMVAGQIIPVVTGQTWEAFVQERIFNPLKMQSCAASYDLIKDRDNIASPHQRFASGDVKPVPVTNISVIGSAGTINCNINGMTKWLQAQLAGGKTPGGAQLFSEATAAQMWSINTMQPLDEIAPLTHTHILGYGLGWEIRDEFGRLRVSHTGGVPGGVTWVSMIPELQLGVLVFTNQEEGAAMEAIGHQILDAYLGAPKRDWVDVAVAYKGRRAAAAEVVQKEVAKATASATPPTLPLDSYAGKYVDSWRGEATVRRDGNKLTLTFSRTSGLQGSLEPYSGNVFIVRWDNRALNADAFVRFTQTFGQEVEGMTMRAVSPTTDFSFDFQDLDFHKLQP